MRQKIKMSGMQPLFKGILMLIFILLLLIPLNMIRSLINEREDLEETATNEVISGAGGILKFIGPIFVIDFEYEELDSKSVLKTKKGTVYALPDHFDVEGSLTAEYRYRGIYKVPVFNSNLMFSGTFSMPPLKAYPDDARIQSLRMLAGFKNMSGLRNHSELFWGDESIFIKSDKGIVATGPGISSENLKIPENGTSEEFSWSMEIDGGQKVSIAPLGKKSKLLLTGDWPSPSFSGERLPNEREWDDTGFKGYWEIPEVSRPINAYWDSGNEAFGFMDEYALTVTLMNPVGTYQRVQRAVKYGILFLLVPFVVFFLYESLAKIRIHPVQYLLAAAANVVFYLLLLALSEHWGVEISYLTASIAVTLLMGIYTWGLSQKKFISISMPFSTAIAYLWLWITLQSEDYALLIGSIGLFVILASTMIMTRKINWYRQFDANSGQRPASKADEKDQDEEV